MNVNPLFFSIAFDVKDKSAITFKKEFGDVDLMTDFIGRENELQRLQELLGDKKVHHITIRGFGGLGKTQLALQAVKNFNSGRALVLSLRRRPDFESVIKTIAEFLELPSDSIKPMDLEPKVKQKLRQTLKDERVILLYLDNMEDIKHAAAGNNKDAENLISFFSKIPDTVKILATSR